MGAHVDHRQNVLIPLCRDSSRRINVNVNDYHPEWMRRDHRHQWRLERLQMCLGTLTFHAFVNIFRDQFPDTLEVVPLSHCQHRFSNPTMADDIIAMTLGDNPLLQSLWHRNHPTLTQVLGANLSNGSIFQHMTTNAKRLRPGSQSPRKRSLRRRGTRSQVLVDGTQMVVIALVGLPNRWRDISW